MHILWLVKSRISGKSHNENQKVVIPSVHDFSLMYEIKITFAADHAKYDKTWEILIFWLTSRNVRKATDHANCACLP